MKWPDIVIEFKSLTKELKRIADALERAYPEHVEMKRTPLKPSDVVHGDPWSVYNKKQEQKRNAQG